MRTLIYTAAIALALAASIPADNASARTEGGLHVEGAVQFPQSRSRIVRHTIRFHIPQGTSPLSQLNIDVPEGLRISDNIALTDKSGRKINANISIMGNKVIVDFPQSVAPASKLELDLNNVRIRGVSNAWIYRVSAKLVGLEADVPIGIAQIRVY
ncbi:hypothetical protein ACE1B6_10040 [Aerosakkonemataceae cyanobacterium BLCC-F154]|uniref:DUF2808 domain-containing protein n=1 Tax=Floridaenema fluviatile BLCC-F154 TaxID=3153640 RepID=A0ABV4YCI2_9CYAN